MGKQGRRYAVQTVCLTVCATMLMATLGLAQEKSTLGTCQRFRGTVGGEVKKDREGLGTCLRFRGCEGEESGPVSGETPVLGTTLRFASLPPGDTGKSLLVSRMKVPLSQAATVATEKVPGTVVEAELVQIEGIPVWELEVYTPEGKEIHVSVDAEQGCVSDSK